MTRLNRRRRSFNVLAAVDAVREAHPEFRVPLTITSLRRVLLHEGIDVVRRPIRAYSYVEGALGSFAIVLRAGLNPRHERRVLAHEYAHIKLHYTEGEEVQFQRTPCRRGDPRELEAQLFVRLLELGASATPDHADVAKFVSALDAPTLTPRVAPQLPLPLPEPMPVFKPVPEPFDDGRAYERRIAKRAGKKSRAFLPRPVPDDFDRVLFFDPERGTARFTDLTGRLWWLYNGTTRELPGGRRRWVPIRDFQSPEVRYRVFVNSIGERRVYEFANRSERRTYRANLLDRQLAAARKLDQKPSSTDAARSVLSLLTKGRR